MTFGRGISDSASVELAARAIGSTLREAAAKASGGERMAVEAERLRRTVAQTPPSHVSRRRSLRVALAAAALCCTVIVGGYIALYRAAAPLSVEAQTAFLQGNAVFSRVGIPHLVVPDGRSTELRFSDGSRVTVESGARLRIQDSYSNGASLLLEKGQAQVKVVHREGNTRWSVAAGPFSVVVTGTRFDIAWNPTTERVIVELHEGRVEIKGPKFASPATLMGGQRFEALANEPAWSVTPLGLSHPPTGSPVKPLPSASHDDRVSEAHEPSLVNTPIAVQFRKSDARAGLAVSASTVRGEVSAAASSAATNLPTVPEGRQWAKLVAAGEFRQVTREADTMGLMVCLSRCSASDLRALADAARYSGRLDTAEAALRVLHDRFPAQASSAAYLLGVVDEARSRNVTALRWYDEYLTRVGEGGFAAEARAARLRMLVRTVGNVAAREAAREYLVQYPNGAAAGLATKVLEGR